MFFNIKQHLSIDLKKKSITFAFTKNSPKETQVIWVHFLPSYFSGIISKFPAKLSTSFTKSREPP